MSPAASRTSASPPSACRSACASRVATIRQAGRLLPAVLLSLAGMIAACGGLAFLVLLVTDVSFSDAYLATTPGGLYAVLAVAVGGGGNVGSCSRSRRCACS